MTVRRDSVQTQNETALGGGGLTPFPASARGVCPRPNRDSNRRRRRSLSPILVQYGEGLNGETARHSHCVTLACNPFSWGLFRLLFPL